MLGFVENKVFAAARPKDVAGGLGYNVTLADAVTAALPFIEEGFPGKPLTEARLRTTIGRSFDYLGKPRRPLRSIAGSSAPTTPTRSRAWPTWPTATWLPVAHPRRSRSWKSIPTPIQTIRFQCCTSPR